VKADNIKKMGCFATFMSLLKGFLCTAIIYLPYTFVTAGYMFQIIAIAFSACLTTYCAYLLIEVKNVIGLTSYVDIGEKAYGKKMRGAVQLFLGLSQFGFCVGYVFFIIDNVHYIVHTLWPNFNEIWFTAVGMFVIFSLLCFIRKIEIFAQTHLFADIMIFVTLLYIIVEGCFVLKNQGKTRIHELSAINSVGWAGGFGFSIYSFEGIGIILPVGEITANKDGYFKVAAGVIMLTCGLYLGFGIFCALVWGSDLQVLIRS